jgi:hypothetical protein
VSAAESNLGQPQPTDEVERREQAIAWELRGAWISRRRVVVTLSDRCTVRRLEGRVTYVAVSGAYVKIAGWHVPTVDVLGVVSPHFAQRRGAC